MSKVSITGIGHAECDHECSGLRIDNEAVYIDTLIEHVGVESLNRTKLMAFEDSLDDDATVNAIIAAAPVEPADGFTEWYESISEEDRAAYDAGRDAAYYRDARAEYRAESGRQFPRVYRITVTIEAEPLSDEESLAYWQAKNAQSRDKHTIGQLSGRDGIDQDAVKLAWDAVLAGCEISYYDGNDPVGEPFIQISTRNMPTELHARISAFKHAEYQSDNPNFDHPQWFLNL